MAAELPDDRDPATRTPGAWTRAALELDSWANDSYLPDLVTARMRERAADLRRYALEGRTV